MYGYLHIEPVIRQDYLQNLFKGVRDLVAKFLDILKNNIKFKILYFSHVSRTIYRDSAIYFSAPIAKMSKRGSKKIICNFSKNYLHLKTHI